MNPELRRNLWLEITAHRLIGTPLVLALAFLALAVVDESLAMTRISWAALGGFGVLTALWGTRLAANSVIDELADKTWDWQRLSTLGPWTMTWGKLLGSTAFAWYGGLLCLAVFLLTLPNGQYDSPLRLCLILILGSLALHAAAVASALHAIRQGVVGKRRSLGILLLIIVFNLGSLLAARNWGAAHEVVWYGTGFRAVNFMLLSLLVFALWAIVGAYRAMCQSLMVRTTPWLWLLFLIFLTVYSAGFVWNSLPGLVSPSMTLPWIGFVWGLLFTYVMMFTELTGPLVVRRITWKVQLGQWRRAFEEMPCWPVTWVFTAICAMGVAMDGSNSNFGLWQQWSITPIPATLLAARDAGILLFFLAAPRPKRAVGTTIIYLIVLSWILPGLLHAIGMTQLAQFVLPFGQGSITTQLLGSSLQALVALSLAWHRIRKSFTP